MSQATPAGGVLFLEWTTASALVLYWIESVLLLGACVLLLERVPPQGRVGLPTTRDLLLVHGAALGIFGGFFAGFLMVAAQNHGVEVRLSEIRSGAPVVALCVALGLVVDGWSLTRRGAPLVLERVEMANSRFALFWIVGFFGVLAAMLFDRAGAVFWLFAGMKGWLELARFVRPVAVEVAPGPQRR